MKKKIIVGLCLTTSLYASDIVIDKDTDLIWQDNSTIVSKTYKEAIRYCQNLSLGGYDDWRLPNIDELMSISDKSRYNPAVKKIFKHTKNSYYWSSSRYKGNSSRAWIVYFGDGYGHGGDISSYNYVRCVR